MTAASRAGSVIATAFGDPGAWLLGAAGFIVRGGIVLLVVPIWAAPSPVGISILVGPRIIDTQRLDATDIALALLGLAVIAMVVAGALLAAAWCEARAFERLRGDHERDVEPGGVEAAAGWPLINRLVGVELAALLPVLGAAVLGAGPIADAVRTEVLLPSDLGEPLILRAARGASGPLLALAVSIVLAEAIHGFLSRRVLLPGGRAAGRPSPLALLRAAVSVIAVAALGWLVAAIVLVPATAAVIFVWGQVRDAWLSGAPFGPGISPALVRTMAATVAFVAVWVAALLLGGAVSSLRGALWTARALPGGRDWTADGD